MVLEIYINLKISEVKEFGEGVREYIGEKLYREEELFHLMMNPHLMTLIIYICKSFFCYRIIYIRVCFSVC